MRIGERAAEFDVGNTTRKIFQPGKIIKEVGWITVNFQARSCRIKLAECFDQHMRALVLRQCTDEADRKGLR